MDKTLFYVFGIALVASALGVSAIGLRFEGFPPTRAVLAAVVVYFAGMVAATTTFAVLNARDEQHSRQAKEAQAQATQPAGGTTTTTGGTTTTSTTTGAAPKSKATTVKLAANPTQIAYDTKSLSAKAGNVAIDFTNPNTALPHDVCVQTQGAQSLGCSDQVTGSSTSLSLQSLKAGKYTFYCSVPGHEQAGMKGTLTVQ